MRSNSRLAVALASAVILAALPTAALFGQVAATKPAPPKPSASQPGPPESLRDLKILEATYTANTKHTDVTQKVLNAFNAGKPSIAINRTNFGSPIPGTDGVFILFYRVKKETRMKIFRNNEVIVFSALAQ